MSVEVPVGIKNAAFKRGLDEMREQAHHFKHELAKDNPLAEIGAKLGGALALGGLIESFDKLLERFSHLKDVADRFGESAVTLQKIEGVGKTVGLEYENTAKILAKLTLSARKCAAATEEGADKFSKLGIDAGAFAELGMDQKLLSLAKAFEKANEDGNGAGAMLDVLGVKGASIIPLISQGPEELAKKLAEVPALGDEAVESLKKLDDKIIEMKQSMAGFAIWAAKLVEKGGAMVGAWVNMITHGADEAAKIFDEQCREIDEFYEAQEDRKPIGMGDEDDEAAAVEKAKTLKQLKEEIVALERKNRLEALDGEDRLNAIYKERDDLLAKANDKTVDGLKAKKAAMELDSEASRLADDLAGKAEAADKQKRDLMAQHDDALQKAKDADAEQEEKNQLDAIKDPKAKAAALQEKQKQLEDEAHELALKAQANTWEDPTEEGRDNSKQLLTESFKKSTQAKALAGQINELLGNGDDDSSNKSGRNFGRIFASQLASVGLGGHAAAFGPAERQLTEAKKQTQLLTQLLGILGASKGQHRLSPALASDLQRGPLRMGHLNSGHL